MTLMVIKKRKEKEQSIRIQICLIINYKKTDKLMKIKRIS